MPPVALQWSHAQPNVETYGAGPNIEILLASMEPRSAERGNTLRVYGVRSARAGFNGATLSRTWKPRGTGTAHAGYRYASMEPRSAERGNPCGASGAENCGLGFNGATLSRTWKHAADYLTAFLDELASMEPRSAERGNLLAPATPHGRAQLQWSHAQPNVETWSFAAQHAITPAASMEPRSA